jgi:hypothetical protein
MEAASKFSLKCNDVTTIPLVRSARSSPTMPAKMLPRFSGIRVDALAPRSVLTQSEIAPIREVEPSEMETKQPFVIVRRSITNDLPLTSQFLLVCCEVAAETGRSLCSAAGPSPP